jgi:hypothetical protein
MAGKSMRYVGGRGLLLLIATMFAVGSLMGGTAHAKSFKDANMKGGYGCLGLAELGAISQIMQFTADGKGNITSGKIYFALEGELCTYSLSSGSYNVDSSGVGTMTLNWSLSANDPDMDLDCSATELGTGFGEAFAIVLDSSGRALEFNAQDDFLSGPEFTGTDPGDLFMDGSCTRQ